MLEEVGKEEKNGNMENGREEREGSEKKVD